MKTCIRCGKKIGIFSRLVYGTCKECSVIVNTNNSISNTSRDNDELLNQMNTIGINTQICNLFNSLDECENSNCCDNSSSCELSNNYENLCDSSSCDSECSCDFGGCD